MSEHPNINYFSETIYLQRYDYFKFFAESYFYNTFWQDVLKREKKSINKLIAFFYIINHKCHTDKQETSKIAYQSLKKFIGNDYSINEFVNIFDSCHQNAGSKAILPFFNIGQKKIFADFEDDYMKFEIETFNNAKMIGDSIIFQIPKTKKEKKLSEKKIIENLEIFFNYYLETLKDNSFIKSKDDLFKKIANTGILLSDDLLICARFFGVMNSFADRHLNDLGVSDTSHSYNKANAFFALALNNLIPNRQQEIFDFFFKIRMFDTSNPGWEEEYNNGQFYLLEKYNEGYDAYDEFYSEVYK